MVPRVIRLDEFVFVCLRAEEESAERERCDDRTAGVQNVYVNSLYFRCRLNTRFQKLIESFISISMHRCGIVKNELLMIWFVWRNRCAAKGRAMQMTLFQSPTINMIRCEPQKCDLIWFRPKSESEKNWTENLEKENEQKQMLSGRRNLIWCGRCTHVRHGKRVTSHNKCRNACRSLFVRVTINKTQINREATMRAYSGHPSVPFDSDLYCRPHLYQS